jgi:hypothetical protein
MEPQSIIYHGIPKHDYFVIAVPPSYARKPIDEDGAVITLKDQKNHLEHKVQIEDMWTFTLDELAHQDALCKWAYGLTAVKLAMVMLERYPEVKEKELIRFILLKKL